jgi:hypothetical protein
MDIVLNGHYIIAKRSLINAFMKCIYDLNLSEIAMDSKRRLCKQL